MLESLGHDVEPTHVAALDDPEFVETFLLVWAAGVGLRRRPLLARQAGSGDRRRTRSSLSRGRSPKPGAGASASDFLDARGSCRRSSRRVAQWYEGGFDLLLTPTIAEPPPLIGEFDSPPDNPLHGLFRAAELVPFTPPFNVTGQPAISLPLHWNDRGPAHRGAAGGALRARGRPPPGGGSARGGRTLGPPRRPAGVAD